MFSAVVCTLLDILCRFVNYKDLLSNWSYIVSVGAQVCVL